MVCREARVLCGALLPARHASLVLWHASCSPVLCLAGLLAATHAVWAVPAQILMRRYSPKPFYLLGSLAGILGNGIMVLGAYWASFPLLLAGSPFTGIANAYINFLRFEAARFVPSPKALPLAISAVIGGGVMGGALGPLVSRFTRSIIPAHEFLATYAVSMGLWVLEALLLLLIPFGPRRSAADASSTVPGEPGKAPLHSEACSPDGMDPGHSTEQGHQSPTSSRNLGTERGAQIALGPGLQIQAAETGREKSPPHRESTWDTQPVTASHQGADCQAQAGDTRGHVHQDSAGSHLPSAVARGHSLGTTSDDSTAIGGKLKQVAARPHAEALQVERAGDSLWSADMPPPHSEGVADSGDPQEAPTRKWFEFLRDPAFVTSVCAATFSYTFMATFMLTAVLAMTFVQPGGCTTLVLPHWIQDAVHLGSRSAASNCWHHCLQMNGSVRRVCF